MKITRTHLLLIGVILLLVSSFIHKKQTQPDYLIFGHFYEECVDGKCMKLYKIEHNSLYVYLEDSTNYPSFNQFHAAGFRRLSDEKYKKVRTITGSIPQALLETKSGFIGTTDTNWSGYYIEYARNGEKKFWIFDEKRRDVPAEFFPLLDEIQKSIGMLSAQ